jgi:hypothetical protein
VSISEKDLLTKDERNATAGFIVISIKMKLPRAKKWFSVLSNQHLGVMKACTF